MPLLVHAVGGTLALHGETVQLPGEPHGEVGDVDHLLYLAAAFGEDFAHFQGDQGAQVVLRAAQFLGHLANDLAAFGRGEHAPPPERLRRPAEHLLVVLAGGHLHMSQHASVARADGGQVSPAGLRNPVAVAGAGIHGLNLQPFQNAAGLHNSLCGRCCSEIKPSAVRCGALP